MDRGATPMRRGKTLARGPGSPSRRRFPNSDAKGFLGSMKQLEAGTRVPEGMKAAVSQAARALDRAVKGESSPLLDFFGHVSHHPPAEPYSSQAALRDRDHVAKLGAFPASTAQAALADQRLDTSDEDGTVFRQAVLRYLDGREARFEVRVPLCLNLDDDSLAAHRPSCSLMRARLETDQALSRLP